MKDTMTCPHCNSKVVWNALRCHSCGWPNPGASSAATGCFFLLVLPVAGIIWYVFSFQAALRVLGVGVAIIVVLYFVGVFLMRR